jgi:hypothetical protein
LARQWCGPACLSADSRLQTTGPSAADQDCGLNWRIHATSCASLNSVSSRPIGDGRSARHCRRQTRAARRSHNKTTGGCPLRTFSTLKRAGLPIRARPALRKQDSCAETWGRSTPIAPPGPAANRASELYRCQALRVGHGVVTSALLQHRALARPSARPRTSP